MKNDAQDSVSSEATHPEKPNRRTLGVVFLVILIDLMGFSIIFPLFPAMLDFYFDGKSEVLNALVRGIENVAARSSLDNQFMVSVLFGGILGSLYSFLQFIFSPIWGRLSDRMGRRKILLITLTGTALSYVGWFFAGSFALLVAARVFAGVMSGNISVATAVVSDVTSKEKRTKGMALIGVAFGLGFLIGPAVGGLSSLINLADMFPALVKMGVNPFSMPALIALVLSLINLIWAYGKLPETLREENRSESSSRRSRSRLAGLFSVQNKDIRRVCWVYFLYLLSFSGMEYTLTFLAVERYAYSPKDNGMMFVFIGFCLILVQGGLVRRLAPKVGEKLLVLVGVAFGFLAFGTISILSGHGIFYVALAFLAVSAGFATPSMSSMVSLYAGASEQGRYLGLFRSAGSLARAFGPLSAATLYFSFGSKVSYAAGALLLIVPFIMGLCLKKISKA